MAAQKASWQVARISLPEPGFSAWSTLKYVRTDGNVFQVKRESTVPLPCADSPESYIQEIQSATAGLIDVYLDFNEGNDEYSSEITVVGWREATAPELAIIASHKF